MSDLPLDEFEVIHTAMTPGEMAHQGRLIILHNAENPCHTVDQLKSRRTQRLGADVPPRPEFRQFCKLCEWPATETALKTALTRIPERFR